MGYAIPQEVALNNDPTGQLFTTPIRSLADRFDAAVSWLGKLGIRTQVERVRILRADLHVAVRLASGQGDPLSCSPRVIASLNDAADLSRIHKCYVGRETKAFAERLSGFITGPLPGDQEKIGFTRPRDVLAELSWASMLDSSGYKTRTDTHRDGPDVEEDIETGAGPRSIVYAVKRPHTTRNLHNPLRDGRRQIQAAMKGGGKTGPHPIKFGCVVLILDHVLPRCPPELSDVRSQEEASSFLFNTVVGWGRSHLADISRAKGGNRPAIPASRRDAEG